MNIFQMLFTLMAVAFVIYALIKGFQFLMIQMATKNDKAVVWIQFHSAALPDIQSTKDYELVFKGKQYYSFFDRYEWATTLESYPKSLSVRR
ncbi:hypothetical protein P7J38_00105 [Streptococcus suis]|uniref:hypothetical protein n=1 Tax=Streptococcus suis TaxID=1307 RepID=UPI0038B72965